MTPFLRATYWSIEASDPAPIKVSRPIRLTLYGCIAGMLYLGLFPNGMVQMTAATANLLR